MLIAMTKIERLFRDLAAGEPIAWGCVVFTIVAVVGLRAWQNYQERRVSQKRDEDSKFES